MGRLIKVRMTAPSSSFLPGVCSLADPEGDALRISLSDAHLSSCRSPGSMSSSCKAFEDALSSRSQTLLSSISSCRLCHDTTDSSSSCSLTSCLSSSEEEDTVSTPSDSPGLDVPAAFWGQSVEDEQGEHLLLDVSLCSQLVRDLHEETGAAVMDLLELDQAGILEKIPRNDEGQISSVGSLMVHTNGTCFPCVFWFRGMCPKSVMCSFCHFRHPGQKVKRHKPKRSQVILRGVTEKQADLVMP